MSLNETYKINESVFYKVAGEYFYYNFPFEDAITEEIESYKHLKSGWDFGNGEIPSLATILTAKFAYLVGKNNGFHAEPHPNTDGSVTIILYKEDHFLDVEVKHNARFKIRYEIGKGNDFKVIFKDINSNFDLLQSLLIQITAECQNSLLEPLEWTNIVRTKRDSETTKFLPTTKEEFRYSISSAQKVAPHKEYVLT